MAGESLRIFPDSKVRGAYMGPIWGRQDPGGPHVGTMNFAIWVILSYLMKPHGILSVRIKNSMIDEVNAIKPGIKADLHTGLSVMIRSYGI